MKTLKEKVVLFYEALIKPYNEEFKLNGDVTEDITAMLLALQVFYQNVTDTEIGPVEFTHLLNLLIIQNMMTDKDDEDEEMEESKNDEEGIN